MEGRLHGEDDYYYHALNCYVREHHTVLSPMIICSYNNIITDIIKSALGYA